MTDPKLRSIAVGGQTQDDDNRLVGHRSTLEAFHDGHIALDREGDHFAAHERQKQTSPS